MRTPAASASASTARQDQHPCHTRHNARPVEGATSREAGTSIQTFPVFVTSTHAESKISKDEVLALLLLERNVCVDRRPLLRFRLDGQPAAHGLQSFFHARQTDATAVVR